MTTRRDFLKALGLFSTATAASPFGIDLLGASSSAFAAPNPTDYKAMICLFLYGGSDCANTVIPFGTAEHAEYLRLRGGANGIGIPRGRLAATQINAELALNPGLRKTANLFKNGNAAVIANVGPLAEPTKRVGAELVKVADPTKPARLPERLRSHNDQQATWQSFEPEAAGTPGWGGRLGDQFLNANGTSRIFTSMSAFGANSFSGGVRTTGYQVTAPSGALAIDAIDPAKSLFGSSAHAQARELLTKQADGQLFADELNLVRRRSIAAEKLLSAELGKTTVGAFPASSLGAQLAIVSRSIQAGRALGLKRQIFLVGLGGFDHHDDLNELDASNQPVEGTHEELLGQVDDALGAIFAETQRLGIANNVTTFTASDFGRTLTSNGDGSDHGWGSHHFVVGGAVAGNKVYGKMPEINEDDPSYLPRGVLLPSTSVDQLACTLARWFGVPMSEMDSVVPNIGAFTGALGTPPNLGFLDP